MKYKLTWLVLLVAEVVVLIFCKQMGFIQTLLYPIFTAFLLAFSTFFAFQKLRDVKDVHAFTIAYLGTIVLQMLAWIGYLATILFLDELSRKENTIVFLINTLIFIGLQTVSLFLERGKRV
ncbi:MAG: hypothetical protein O9340_05365 [Cyclobacteriaceae bacterium]|jgi:hypothetical protein|nr:hypothetical protein [Cyclobacteriaceae bacterium]